MKHLKLWENFIKESMNEDELNHILDKINDSGFDSLDEIEIKKLKNYGNENFNIKDDIINDIKYLLGDDEFTMGELEVDSSPVFKSIDQEIHLVERLNRDDVDIFVYGGYKYNTEIDEYSKVYSDLDLDTLIQIKEVLENAKDFGLI